MPKSRSLCPSMPRKFTDDKSGSFRLASPPGASASTGACANAAAAPINVTKNPTTDFNAVRQKFEQVNEGKFRIKRPPVRRWSHVWQDRSTFDLPPDKDSLAGAYILREITTQNRLLYQESPSFVKKIGGLVAIRLLDARAALTANGQCFTVGFRFLRAIETAQTSPPFYDSRSSAVRL